MSDPRNRTLAHQLIHYSTGLKPGQVIYVEIKGVEAMALGQEIIREASLVGGVPFWYYNDETLSRPFVLHAGAEQFEKWGQFHRKIMEMSDVYIAVRGSTNPFDLSDASAETMKQYNTAYWNQVHALRVQEKTWCVLRYPSPSMAISAQMPTEALADFYYDVCTLDYARMSKAMDPLVSLMAATDQVHIKGPGTDLRFSIKGLPPVKCDGHRNIPDGEVYTAPVRDSVEGIIAYNAPSMYQSKVWKGITLRFDRGRIVDASCEGDVKGINDIFDTDEGARYVGEFALGVNPYIRKPMLDTLFDEKISGSFHFTPGNAYEKCNNGNKSAIHWDLVNIQSPEWGGGEIWFDGVLIRKDGRFVHPDLLALNPENLG